MGLNWKCFERGEFIASTQSPVTAAAVAGMTGDGVVKFNGRIVWREGKEALIAGDSWDGAAEIMLERARAHQLERLNRYR